MNDITKKLYELLKTEVTQVYFYNSSCLPNVAIRIMDHYKNVEIKEGYTVLFYKSFENKRIQKQFKTTKGLIVYLKTIL